MPEVNILMEEKDFLTISDDNGNVVTLTQGDESISATGPVEKTNMFTGSFTGVLYEDDLESAVSFYRDFIGLQLISGNEAEDRCMFKAGDAEIELRRQKEKTGELMGPSMIGLEVESVNKLFDRLSEDERYREAYSLRDTDFDARRLFSILDPGGNVVEFYAYLKNVREEILLH